MNEQRRGARRRKRRSRFIAAERARAKIRQRTNSLGWREDIPFEWQYPPEVRALLEKCHKVLLQVLTIEKQLAAEDLTLEDLRPESGWVIVTKRAARKIIGLHPPHPDYVSWRERRKQRVEIVGGFIGPVPSPDLTVRPKHRVNDSELPEKVSVYIADLRPSPRMPTYITGELERLEMIEHWKKKLEPLRAWIELLSWYDAHPEVQHKITQEMVKRLTVHSALVADEAAGRTRSVRELAAELGVSPKLVWTVRQERARNT